MVWDALNIAVALMSLCFATLLWYRTIISRNPVVDLVPEKANASGDMLVVCLRVRNPDDHSVILHSLRFRSPPRKETSVQILEDQGARDHLARELRESQLGHDDTALLDVMVPPHDEISIRLTFAVLDRPLKMHLRWSRQSHVVFPWWPKRVKRSAKQLRLMTQAATGVL